MRSLSKYWSCYGGNVTIDAKMMLGVNRFTFSPYLVLQPLQRELIYEDGPRHTFMGTQD